MGNRLGTGQVLSAAATMFTVLMASGSAHGEISVNGLRQDLQLAVCLNDWDAVVEFTGALIASPDISAAQRHKLVSQRHQLQAALQRSAVRGSMAQGCEQRLSRYVQAFPTVTTPLDWDAASYSAYGAGQLSPTPDQVARQQRAASRAGLTPTLETEIPALSPATFIQTPTGSGVSAGAVNTGRDVFAFIGGGGDPISISIAVTDMLAGRLYTDDDSQIFLFDSAGTLLAENDDLSRLQSQIMDFPLPAPGIYYVAVTTYNNDPILDSAQRITDWNDNGGSSIEYTITVTGLTPASQLVLPPDAPLN